jgi:O-antigen/teichoic acid export membrane protein
MYTSKSYNRIIKSTGLFGGVQIINILISIIRSKITALLLGPSGVGLYGLFQSLATTIQLLTGLGIGSSAVKFVASGANSGDGKKLAESISSLRLWALATGIFGVLIMVCLSGTLSRWMFGNKAHATGIALISVTLLFTSISNAQLAILQGIRDLRSLAKVSVFGQFSGLFFILPLYWLLGEKRNCSGLYSYFNYCIIIFVVFFKGYYSK